MKTIKNDFPALRQQIHGKALTYLDSGASTLKPQCVIDALTDYYATFNSNVHRGAHHLSNLATEAYENARKRVQTFINAAGSEEIIFTKGTTEAINLLAFSFGEAFVGEGDEIVVSQMEHHANIVPWQQLCKRKNARLKVIPILEDGTLNMVALPALLTKRTKLLAITHISNVLGTINPVEEIIALAHAKDIPVLVDGAQGIVHRKVDVRKLDVDFYVFSGHKLYAPMGIGVLYGKASRLNAMPPYQYGGEMIDKVRFEETTFNVLPFKFEAGTPNVGGAVGLHKAIDYLCDLDWEEVLTKEEKVLEYAVQGLQKIDGLRIFGKSEARGGVISFLLEGIHPYDAGTLLDQMGIAVRTGHHCAQPLMDFYRIPGTVRASFGIFNDEQDVDLLCEALLKVQRMLS